MSITTLDQAVAGMQPPVLFTKAVTGTMVAGRCHSTFYQAGFPGTAVAPTPGIGGVALTVYPGQLPFNNPVSGETRLARLQGQCTIAGTLMLCDRLWHNSGLGLTITTAQTINSATWPARDRNGLTNGDDVFIGFEVSSVLGAGTPTLTMSYTNSAGVASKTGTNIIATATAPIAGTVYEIGLAAGDIGVRSVQSFTLSATYTSGAAHLFAYRVLAALELSAANVPNAIDFLTGGAVKMYDNTVPFLMFRPSATTSSNISGQIIYTQG